MKRATVLSLCLLLTLSCLFSCGGGKSTVTMADLQKSNEDLTRRVKSLEDDSLEMNKKLIQQEQAMQALHEQLRDMENIVNKIQLGPTR